MKGLKKLSQLSCCIYAFVLLGLSVIPLSLLANCHPHHRHQDALELGIALETEFWTLVQKQKVDKFSKKISPIFQGLNESGVYNRREQIDSLTGVTLTSFLINNPKSHRSHDVLVFSYDFIALGSDLLSGPSLTVWRKIDGSWKMVSHSYVPFH